MSDVQVITKVEKEKDPRRVASGKRLASISVAAKENAKKKRLEGSEQEPSGVPQQDADESGGYSVSVVIAGAGVLATIACLYLAYKRDNRESSVRSKPTKCEEADQPSEQRKTGKQYSLDD